MLPKLKTQRFYVQRLDLEITLRELSGKAAEEIFAAKDKASALTCKFGVVEWEAESAEDIAANVGAMTLEEIGRAVFELTGLNLPKNSEPDRNVVSISASR